MTRSAIEIEFSQWAESLTNWMRLHDRGVLFGIALAFTPVPPLPLLGLIISIVNYYLVKIGRLDSSERLLLRVGILVSVVNFFLSIYLASHLLKDIISWGSHLLIALQLVDIQALPLKIPSWLLDLFDSFRLSRGVGT
jgi:hypothetical protein